jgi:DNA-binding NarL/FixJ family response regulator
VQPVPLVGRAAALDEVRWAWQRVATGGRGVPVVVTGAAGTGKSALVAAALETFGPVPVLSGAARVHSPAPYDWLAAVLARSGPPGLPVPPDALAWLAQDPDVPRERYAPAALLRLAVRAVRALVGAGPAVVVVEDLHALDPASLNLVAALAAADLPALLVVTSRPPVAAVSPELTAQTLARLTGTAHAVRRHLSPLDAAQVGELLSRAYAPTAVPDAVAHDVWQRTGGNPYCLTELLAVTDGDPAALAATPLPGHLPGPAGPPAAELTARELDVLGCLAAGMSNKQIARELGISIRTVTVHVSNLLRKTASASRTEAALWAVQRGTLRAAAGV